MTAEVTALPTGEKKLINMDLAERFFLCWGANHLPPAHPGGSALPKALEPAGAPHPSARLLKSIRDEGL